MGRERRAGSKHAEDAPRTGNSSKRERNSPPDGRARAEARGYSLARLPRLPRLASPARPARLVRLAESRWTGSPRCAINSGGFAMDILSIVISLFVLLFAITVHEAAHAWAANRMGDPTASTWAGSPSIPSPTSTRSGPCSSRSSSSLIGAPAFGWAKPVPVNPYNLPPPPPRQPLDLPGRPGGEPGRRRRGPGLAPPPQARSAPGVTAFLQELPHLPGQRFPSGFYPAGGAGPHPVLSPS